MEAHAQALPGHEKIANLGRAQSNHCRRCRRPAGNVWVTEATARCGFEHDACRHPWLGRIIHFIHPHLSIIHSYAKTRLTHEWTAPYREGTSQTGLMPRKPLTIGIFESIVCGRARTPYPGQ